ncbi:dTMP kinase [Clonorchis sinensis]|uniref:dTMP kinase n=2 Tax=Clonorchis sinensis TaxID=79923 RepID=H2KU01_CLOSI|nr:dTMP kinase [Clonorchis sinensis]
MYVKRSITSIASLWIIDMGDNRSHSGIFIAIEGADRTGKSTQASLLADALTKLTGRTALLLKFPDRDTALGKCLDNYLKGDTDVDTHALHLLFTANRWEKQDELRSALSSGCCVVADRYSYSGIAYTAAKPPPTPSWQWCCAMEKGLVEPDLVICLTPEHFDHLKDRNGYGNERYETEDFQRRVLENYTRLAKDAQYTDYSELGVENPDNATQFWHFVQATNKTMAQVHECLMAIVKRKLESMKLPEISDTDI